MRAFEFYKRMMWSKWTRCTSIECTGKNVTFAVAEDPRAVAAAVAGIVHDNCSVEQAWEIIQQQTGQAMDALA